jgi:chemotaxis protein MotA
MDILSVLGLTLAAIAILGGSILKGSGVGSLINGAAVIIVVVGTFAAILLQTPMRTFVRALRIFRWTIFPPVFAHKETIEKIVSWAQVARREGLLGLETASEEEEDIFSRKGLQLLVDGSEPEIIRQIMELEIETREQVDTQAAKVYEGMGIYAPTLGIIGAVMGLMAVMQNLADPSKLGSGIAAAFTATIYGIGMANLFFLPVASKLKGAVSRESQFREMVMEGIIAIAEGENPRNIETKLRSYMG